MRREVGCPACIGTDDFLKCPFCERARLKRSVGPLVGDGTTLAVAELQRLTLDAERVAADVAEAYEAGRLAVIRADVERESERLEAVATRYRGYAGLLSGEAAAPYQANADCHVARAADCRAWLEATK